MNVAALPSGPFEIFDVAASRQEMEAAAARVMAGGDDYSDLVTEGPLGKGLVWLPVPRHPACFLSLSGPGKGEQRFLVLQELPGGQIKASISRPGSKKWETLLTGEITTMPAL